MKAVFTSRPAFSREWGLPEYGDGRGTCNGCDRGHLHSAGDLAGHRATSLCSVTLWTAMLA